jgi:hypothetical protein
VKRLALLAAGVAAAVLLGRWVAAKAHAAQTAALGYDYLGGGR